MILTERPDFQITSCVQQPEFEKSINFHEIFLENESTLVITELTFKEKIKITFLLGNIAENFIFSLVGNLNKIFFF